VFKVIDSSTANGGVTINPTLFLINQNATGGTISGNLIDAQLAGTSKFSVTTAGNLTTAGSLTATGLASCTSVQTNGSGLFSCGSGGGSLQAAYDADSSGEADIVTSSASKTVLIKAGSTFDAAALFHVQNSGGVNLFTVDSESSTDPLEVQIGSSTDDSTSVFLGIDNETTFAEATSCTSAIHGSIYYNGTTNAVRACVNGAWEDMLSTAALGLQLFGVVPDSGSSPGDLASVTGAGNGPCKVQWASNTSVTVAGCTAYSGGRKVIVAATTLSSIPTTNGNFVHVCLGSTDGQPALSSSSTEIASLNTLSMPSVTAPLLCLADIKTTGTAIADLYDTRTFTTSTKETVTVNSAAGLGYAITGSATQGVFASSAATTATFRGVIVATTGAAATTTVNAIIATGGPAWVKSSAGTVNQYILPTATAGYVNTSSTASATALVNIGLATTTFDTTCTSTSNCKGSLLTSLAPR
jgi:hypothetical protein